jgi:tRNA (adenine37-N6)-methyltransferase
MFDNELNLTLKPIGSFKSSKTTPVEAARQASVDLSMTPGIIKLRAGNNFEQAIEDLAGFTHLWVIYGFHQNQSWKPKVDPPRGPGHKVGVFASRSPYRPNPLGLSALKIQKLEGLNIYVESHDILDGSPIYDIKPYLPFSDSFPAARSGWTENLSQKSNQIRFSPRAECQLRFLQENAGLTEFRNVIEQQLQFDPLNSQKKRVKKTETGGVLAFKTWRARFDFDGLETDPENIIVVEISSGYSSAELQVEEDPYNDKNYHRLFVAQEF